MKKRMLGVLPEEVQPTAVENLMPGGTALVSAVDGGGEVCLLEGGPDRPFAPVPLPEAEECDGFRSPCRAGDGLSLTLTRFETFTDEQGRTQTTVVPLPVENRMYGPDGQAAVWGDGPAGDVYTTPVSDGQRMYCVDLTDNGLVTVEADGSWRKEGVLEGWNGGALFARDGRVYYPGKDGVCCWAARWGWRCTGFCIPAWSRVPLAFPGRSPGRNWRSSPGSSC